jgi:hypothetical protein
MSNFCKTVANIEQENEEMENRIHNMDVDHKDQIAEKDCILAEKDALLAHKDMLIAKYKMCLTPHEIQIDESNGELILGSIGKRGMVEDYEDARIRELKKQKVNLHKEVDELEEYKEKLLAGLKVHTGGRMSSLIGLGEASTQGENLGNGDRLEPGEMRIQH